MSGIEAISSRILEIQTTVASVTRRTTQPAMGVHTLQAAAPSSTLSAVSATFDQLLARAQALTAAPATDTFTLNAAGVPSDLAAYGNGQVPAEALAPVGATGHRLWAPAATAFEQLLTAAKADGVDIGITDSYRTYESQVDLAERKGLYSAGGLAAAPGTSDHGWGLSLDLKLDPAALSWMRSNGTRFGFAEDVPREPWHWTFQGPAA